MTNLGHLQPPSALRAADRTTDGSEMFPYLWRHFLAHDHIRDWLMRASPYSASSVSPKNVGQGLAFCCNFAVPPQWEDMAASFDLGEMFIPDHSYSHFMCGSVVAATSFHKHLVCALGPAASRHISCLPSYRTCVRRMVIDLGSSRSINIMEFSWMEDGALIVTCKILVPPDPTKPYTSAGCTGAFALFPDVTPGFSPPLIPRSLVSFVEAPRCPVCIQQDSLGCYCSTAMAAQLNRIPDEYSSAVWPPRLTTDIQTPAIDTFHTIRSRLDLIQHIAHVKITAHMVTTQQVRNQHGQASKTYKLGPSRFVVRSVLFRPSNGFEADTLRQVADKLRLLRAGSLSLASSDKKSRRRPQNLIEETITISEVEDTNSCTVAFSGRQPNSEVLSFDPWGNRNEGRAARSSATSYEGVVCSACGEKRDPTGKCHTCISYRHHPAADEISATGDAANTEDISRVTRDPSICEIPSKRLVCHLCQKTFSQQGSLNRHMKNIHEEKKIPCQFCPMSFGQMFDLKRHQKRKHADRFTASLRRDRVDTRLLRTVTQL